MTQSSRGNEKHGRRAFSAEFRVEAVRLMQERRALGVSLAQVGRELDVRPDLLRKWARRLAQRLGAGAGDVFPGNGQQAGAAEELRRLQRDFYAGERVHGGRRADVGRGQRARGGMGCVTT